MNLREIGWVAWILVAQDIDQWRAVVGVVMNLRIPTIVWKFFSSWATVGL
jgi:hypothetical protein